MCGIAGFTGFDNNLFLARNNTCIQQHRGPDAQNSWSDERIALSHQRLSIIDLDRRSDQPMIKSGLVIVFNGEIYNYKELREQIISANPEVTFDTTSDTEVLLELYRKKKEKCLDDIIGMFAFAIYEIESGILFLARDHFGIKPLFYTRIGNAFAFSSEMKTLVSVPGFDKSINYTSLAGAVNYLWVPGNETMFLNCFKLPPAHYMIIQTGKKGLAADIKQYWQLETAIEYETEDEATPILAKVLHDSIKRHMVSDVPVSSFLSGGLDSSLISVLASQINPDLSTYTISTSAEDKKVEQMPDDEKYARIVAGTFHFDHHEILLRPDIVNELPKMVATLDEPIGDPAAINTYLICKAAREKGVKVLLSGMGADEIFFGYRRQKATLLSLRYKKSPAWLRSLATGAVNMLPVKISGKGIKITRWAKRFLSFANLPLEESYMRSYSYYDQDELKKLFTKDISQSYTELRNAHAEIFNTHYRNDPINQMCYTDLQMFMLGLNLTYTDRASMAASVEVRVPFIDREVISTAMKIAGPVKYKKGQQKYILKKFAEKYLPKEIIYRPKASFGAPIRSWISGELKPMVEDILSERSVNRRGLFNYDFIREMIDEDRRGEKDHAYRIYQLITVELWCRQFIDLP
jgi:asparagine synthase (glutamine-hydrolysing)